MTAIELLALLNEQGISLSVDGADLRVSAPQGGLTEELRSALVGHKNELIDLLGAGRPAAAAASFAALAAQDRTALPLSFAQERLWFLDQLEPGATQYNLPSAIRLTGDLDTAALTRALGQLVARHEALRTVYVTRNREPHAVPLPETDLPVTQHDATGLDPAALHTRLTELSNIPFALETGPLIRAHLLRLADTEHVLLVVVHHIAADGVSLGILMRELALLYAHARHQDAATLPALTAQYGDFAAWQRQQLQGPVLERHLQFWRDQLAGAPTLLELPADYPRPAQPSHRGAWLSKVFSPDLLHQLQQLARDRHATLYMVLLAAFNVLLYRYTRQADILIGTPVAGRQLTQTEDMVGLFVNSVVIRSQLDDALSFTDLLQQVADTSLAALNHQELPFEKLVEELQPERDAAIAPIFQVLFNLQNREGEIVPFAGLETGPIIAETGTAKFDLNVLLEDRSDGLAAWFEYSTDLFSADSIERMLRHFGMLLEGIVANPDSRLVDLPLLSAEERSQLLDDWNRTQVDYPPDATLVSLFEDQVERTPDAPALTFGKETLTYGALNARANQVANHLRESGIAPEDLVGVLMERSVEMVVALYGILKAGGAYVPLDPDYPVQRLMHMIEDAGIGLLLSQSQLAGLLPESEVRVLNLNIGWDAITIRNCPATNPPRSAKPEHAAYVIFTSGSTGRPKGVLNEHRGICNRLLWMQDEYQLGADDRVLQKTPFSFDVSVWEFFWPLQTGAHLIVAEPGGHKDTTYLTNVIRSAGITTLHFVPSMLRSFLQDPGLPECTSLHRVICSGEALTADLQQEFSARSNAQLHNLYGPTEAAIDVTYWACDSEPAATTVPIGRPVANTQIYIVDAADQLVPPGVPGELLIGGVQVARGYVRRPELTAERFVRDPFSAVAGARVYRTGDLARYRPDGVIEFLGRIDFQVKLRGFRIELGEIEAALQNCAGVQQSAVLLREDTPGDQRLAAYFVAEPHAVLQTETLRRALAEALPDYMVPAAFVELAELPLTPNGKLDRNALPAPDWGNAVAEAYAPPRTPVEEALCEIWADLLGLERVGINDHFFHVGGHSLLATRLVARLRDTLNRQLDLRTLFDCPTVAQLAGKLEDGEQALALPPLEPRPADKAVPLSASQQRLWILDKLEPGNPVYNIPWASRLTGILDTTALQTAIDALVARHESLRTAFELAGNAPVQRVSADARVRLQIRDMAGATEAELQKELTRLTQQPFALARAPLLRITLLRVGPEEQVLHIVMHHIVGDAWSTDVLQRELAALYNAARASESSVDAGLPTLPVQYGDYALWQAERLGTAGKDATLDYWTQQLAAAPAVLSLPTDRPRPAVQTYNGAWHGVTIPPELAGQLKTLANTHNATLFMVLFAAFNALLNRYSGQDDIVVGTPIAGRRATELENLIGFFINTLALRTRLDPAADFATLLEQVKHTALDAYAHQELPFEKLVEVLQPVRDTSYAPVFQVMFILQNAPSSPAELDGLTSQPVLFEFGTAKLDLTLSVEERDGGLAAYFEYNTDLFDPDTIERLGAHYARLLEEIVADPDAPLASVDILAASERRAILRDWNATQADYPDACLHELFSAQATATPDAIAVTCNGVTLSYRDLERQSNQLAHRLLERGAGPNVPIALCLQRSPELVTTLLGILKAGSAYVPLDPDFPADRLRYMLEDSGAPVLVTQSSLTALADGIDIQTLCVDQPDTRQRSPAEPALRFDPDQLAYLIYTSGSTGKPKGVAIQHRSAVNFLASMSREPGLTATDRLLAVTTLSFDISILEILGPLLTGATVVLADRNTAADGFALARLLEQDAITVMQATPATWRMLLQTGWRGAPAGTGLKILCGGEALDLGLARQLLACGSELWNMYGPTETTVWSTCRRVQADTRAVTVGRPIANTACYILDAQLEPVPVGVAGELFIGGHGVAVGYHNRPELTAEKFIADPFAEDPGARMYSTGDLARFLPDGEIEVLGRTDFQVKLRGFRIELGEIEAAVTGLAGVQQCVTVLREDTPGDQRLVAYLTTDTDDIEFETLRTQLRERLPDYMLPAAFVRLEEFPLTPNGKVDRKQLPAPEWRAEQAYVAPRNELEESLAALWCEVLGVEQVGVYDDFFTLGGHSLLATRLIARILDDLGIELPLMTLFNRPTIDALAAELAGRDAGAAGTAITRLPRDGKLPLSFAQQRLWFLDELSPGDPMYNIPWVMGLAGTPDVVALQAAIDQVVARHESLRTIFPTRDGEPQQVILPTLPVVLRQEDLRGADEATLQYRLTELAQQRMSLANGPLTYITLLRTGDDTYLLSLVIHHIIFDAWSHGILLRELAGFYNAARAGQVLDLPALEIEFADYAGWQRQWFGSEDFQHQLTYWKNKLAGAPGTLELPTDKPRPPVQTSNGANISRMLSQELHDGIKALCDREGVSLFMMLLAAFNVLMSRYSGQQDLLVGTPISGRKRTELEKIVGFFLHTLVIRADLEGDPAFREFLERTRQSVLEAFAHQEMPFETLVEALDPERDTSRHPLFQVHFVLQHVDIDWQMFDGLLASPMEFEFGTAKFDIMFFVFDANDKLSVRLEYNTDLFEATTIERMIDHFETLLGGILANPDTTVGRLPLLPDAERETLLTEWNQTDYDYPAGATMHGMFETQAARIPDAIALHSAGLDISYRDLNRRANKLARELHKLGIGPEVLAAICTERCAEMIVAMLAIQKAGGAYVPVDPDYPPQRVAHMLADSEAPVLLTQSRLLERLPEHAARIICLDEFDWSTSNADDDNPDAGVQDANLGYVIYTSGSTGLPKGVEIEHRNAVALIEWAGQVFAAEEFAGVLASTSICFDLSVFEIFCPLGLGGRIVLVKDALALPELDAVAGVTLINTVPSAMAELVRIKGVPASVQTVNLAGEPLSTALVNSIYELGTVARVNDLYGPSEDTTYSTWTLREAHASPTIGRPVYNTQAYILDPYGEPVPIGIAGELYLSGAGVTRGYRNRPELTAQRYVANAFADATDTRTARSYRTGDRIRYRADGNMEFLGRLDHQVKLRGFRIELGEIETALASHPAVENTVVMAREDREGDKRLVAYIVASTERLEGAELEQWEAEQVNQWQDLWQEAYSEDAAAEDLALDFKGWNSSYTGEPIPRAEMLSWLAATAANIRSVGDGKILEIGSGTGLIVGQIAPHAESYIATDFSAASVSALERLRDSRNDLAGLELQQCRADQISTFPAEAFDTVVLNSVAQYFPDIDYLLGFVRAAADRLKPGGHIFLGDLRSAALLEAYHTSVQLSQAEDELPLTELAERIRQRTEQEEELLVEPALFVALQKEIPAITGIRYQLKRSEYRNELTRFRYDVILEVNGTDTTLPVPEHADWNEARLNLSALEARLTAPGASALLLTAIPDARIAEDCFALAELEHVVDGTVAELRARGAALAPGVEPESLYALAEHLGLDLQLTGTLPGQMTALFSRGQQPRFDGALMHAPRPVPWRDYGNDPLQGRLQRSLVPILRERLSIAVPEYMMPSAVVIMDAFPLTPNGKIDRKALPAPERKRSEREVYVAPRTPVEEQLVEIWAQVLGIKQIGVHDDFFALGGHSLLATQLISRIRDTLKTELPLLSLFNHPTIAGLAVEISGDSAAAASAMIEPCDRSAPLPLSFAQQRLWFLDQLEGISSAYNVPLALRLDGKVDMGALQQSVNELVARHESLRTRFESTAGKPVQIVVETLEIPVNVVNMPGAVTDELQTRLEQLAQTPFDLANDPLVRVHLLRSDDTSNILLLLMHHIVSDGWSLGILARELAALYAGHCTGEPVALPPLRIQYPDYAVWQRSWLAGEELQRQLSYWEQQLDGAPALLQLPTDRPRQSVQTFRGAHINRTYSVRLGERLRELAGAEDCTLFMVLLAAYNVLLARYAAADDIVVGTPIAGRTRTEVEDLIGFFVNTLAMRMDLSGDPDFIDVIRRAKQTALAAYAHQELPFEKLVEELQPDRDTSHPPVFQTLFVLQENLSDDIGFHGTVVTPLDFELGSAKFDLSLFLVEFADGLTASFEYNTDLFDAATIERMLTQLGTLLEAIVANPARPISALPLLDAAERRHVLEDFNNSAAEIPSALVHELVELQAERTPGAAAVSMGDTALSYAELNARANRLARLLSTLGAAPGTLVGISMNRSIAQAVSVLAVLKSGAAYVPIDPNYPAERVSYMLDDSKAAVLITESDIAAALTGLSSAVVLADKFDWRAGPGGNLGIKGGESVYAIYTSGSTGLPKGVELTHAGLNNLIQWQNTQPGLDTPARTLQFASLSFDVSFQELFTTWAQGGHLVLIDEELRRDLPALARFIAADDIERVYFPYAALQPLADSVIADDNLRFALRDVVVAGEQLQITPAIREMFGKLAGARLHNQYGPSETHVVTAYTLTGAPDSWMALPPIGTPVANTRVYVLDVNQAPVPTGVPGELYLGGAQVARGYIHRKTLTAEKFLHDPFVAHAESQPLARMYRTGDRVRFLPDGNLEYLGRTDDQVKWRGFRIEPGEIEAQLAAHPSLSQAAVLLREDAPGDKRLVAYVVAEAGQQPDTTELRAWLKDRVPDYMVPSAFVVLERMPLTPSGKVARRKLPVPAYADAAQAYVAPRTPIEEALVQIWAEILGVGQVGIHDDFFELGGHSLIATQVIARVRDAFEVDLPLVSLFNHPTVAQLAADVAGASGAGILTPIVASARGDKAPLSFAQQRLWFLDQLEPGNPVYNVPWAMRLHGPVNVNALQAAVNDLVARHETLRTVFVSVLGKPQQQILTTTDVTIELIDAVDEDGAVLQERLFGLARQSFRLDAAPLFRVHLVHTGPDQHVLLLVLHHIVSDGWSLGVLYREIVSLYAGHCSGAPVELPPLPVQYADYALWQQDWFANNGQAQQLDYWRARLTGAPAVLELPTDRPRGATQTYNGAFIERVLPAAIHAGLRDIAREANATLFMVCLAAFNVLLNRYSGQDDISIGTPVAGRRHTEVDNLIGFFINTLVMRNDLTGEPGFADCVQRIKRTALEAFAHQDLPFEKLVDELHPVRDMSHAPLFQVAFIMQNTPWDQTATLHNLEIEPLELDYGVAKFDLSLVMAERREGLLVHFEYNSDLFDRATIERMTGHFETLLLAAISDPRAPVTGLPMLAVQEREQIIYGWNETAAPFADASCIHTLIENRTAQQPDAPAVIFRDTVMSFEELNQRANKVAHFLIARGAGPGKIIGICMERSPDLIACLLAVFKAGAAYVPLDPNYPKDRLEWMLTDSAAPLLLTEAELLAQLPAHNAETVCVAAQWAEIDAMPGTNPACRATAADVAYVIYTSGSTGKPKGVMIPHRGVCNLADAQARTFGLGPADRMLQFASISFDASIFEIVMGLQVGAAMVMAPQDDLLPGAPLLDVLTRHRVTAVTLPPTALSQLPATDLPDLHTITVAGEACPPELVQQWAVGRRFFNLYGPTESTVWASCAQCTPGRRITIGKPISNARLYVLDAQLQPVPAGVPGELCIGGAGLALGYLNRPELTAEKFVADPFLDDPEARIYRTGDLVRFLPDGNIEFLGRIDHQVKVRGFRIELGEIETVLAAHPDVRETVVLARGGDLAARQLVAYVIPRSDAELSLGDLRSHLKKNLPEFMVPAAFVVLEEFPLTPNRKVDRAALPAPDENRLALDAEYVAPRTPAEATLADIWKEVLGVEQVGIHDNFFELGGDSILSIQIIARAGQAQLQLTPKQLFEHQTIADLAVAAASGTRISAEQGIVSGPVMLTPIQHWFTQRDSLDLRHFNQSQLLESDIDLQQPLLEQAMHAVVEHHDALRLRVTCEDGNWSQAQSATCEGEIVRLVNIKSLPADEQARHQLGLSNALQASFDLGRGPLVKALLFKRGPGLPDQLLIAIHHMAVDWVSWNIILDDLQSAYTALAAESDIRLPLKTTSYQAWAEHLAAYANADGLQPEIQWWHSQDWAAAGRIGTELQSGANDAASTQDVTVWLNTEETQQIQQALPKAWRTQINDVLLTAVARAVSDWTGATAAMLDIEGHGREDLFDDVDLSRTVGWFTSLYPVLLKLPEDADPGAALTAVKTQLRDIPNRGIGFGILRYLASSAQTRAALAEIPLPQIGFNYLGLLDHVAGNDALLRPSFAARGREQSSRSTRPHELDIAVAVTAGRMQISVLYSANLHTEATVQRFADGIAGQLRALLAHCLGPATVRLTPADFPLATLEQASLDALLEESGAVDDLYRVTPLQHGMLFHSLFSAERDVYFARFRWRLEGQLDTNVFEAAWQQVVERNSSLRTSFHWEGIAEPVQIVHRDVAVTLQREDWSDYAADAREQRLADYLEADQALRFDFSKPPLMRLTLIRISDTDHHFIWSFHHAIVDGWSVPLVLKEVFALYEAEIAGREARLAEPVPFRTYVEWLSQQDAAGAEQFWRAALAGFSAPTALPAAKVQQVSLTAAPEYEELQLRVSEHTVAALRQLAQQSRLTLNTIIQGVWALLLSRYSGERDVLFGATTSGRPASMPGVAKMIGLFLNTLPVRVGIKPEQPLLAWLQALQEQQLDVRQYEFASLVEVQGWSDIPRGTPMFGSLLAFENYPDMETMWTNTDSVTIREVDGFDRTNFPLTLNVAVFDILHLRVVYDARMFDRVAVQKLTEHFRGLLEEIAHSPQQLVGDLSMLTAGERQQLARWNETKLDYPHDAAMHDAFVVQAQRTPDAIAVQCEDTQLSYGELDRRSNQLAHRLIAAGAGADVPIGLCMERSANMLVALLGILKSGSAYLPLDPGFPADRLRYMLEDSAAPVLVTASGLADLSAGLDIQVLALDADGAALAGQPDTLPEVEIDAGQLAYVIYTSGSTGKPKGVQLEHRAAVNFLHSMIRTPGIYPADRLLAVTTLSFDISILELFTPLYVGATVVVATRKLLSDGFQLARLLKDSGITVMQATPATWRLLLQAGWQRGQDMRVLCGGEALDLELARQLAIPGHPVWNMYGPTETTIWSTCEAIEHDAKRVSVGRPVGNTQVYVLDAGMRQVPVGVAGELFIGGDGVARGYHARPELTAERFVANPFEGGSERIYRTGDLARFLPDGRLEVLGRTDFQVKLRGFRIELGEIETLLAARGDVSQCVVVLREDTPGDQRLVAYLTGSGEPDAEALTSYLRADLPDYMLPAAFVRLDAFPLTPNGKVDRKQLPAPEWTSDTDYVAPRTPEEEVLANIWAEILSVEQVGVHDDFFALGGHSLVAMKLVSRIMERMQVELPLEQLFETPTVAGLADSVNESRDSGAKVSEIASITRRARRKRRTRRNDPD